MKLCFPVEVDNGVESRVYGHFGSAPRFVVLDTETGKAMPVINGDQKHAHGGCNPIMALKGQPVDAIIVGGIGAGALNRLMNLGIKVYRAEKPMIRENVELFAAGRLPLFTLQQTCAGHSQDGGCSHS